MAAGLPWRNPGALDPRRTPSRRSVSVLAGAGQSVRLQRPRPTAAGTPRLCGAAVERRNTMAHTAGPKLVRLWVQGRRRSTPVHSGARREVAFSWITRPARCFASSARHSRCAQASPRGDDVRHTMPRCRDAALACGQHTPVDVGGGTARLRAVPRSGGAYTTAQAQRGKANFETSCSAPRSRTSGRPRPARAGHTCRPSGTTSRAAGYA